MNLELLSHMQLIVEASLIPYLANPYARLLTFFNLYLFDFKLIQEFFDLC